MTHKAQVGEDGRHYVDFLILTEDLKTQKKTAEELLKTYEGLAVSTWVAPDEDKHLKKLRNEVIEIMETYRILLSQIEMDLDDSYRGGCISCGIEVLNA